MRGYKIADIRIPDDVRQEIKEMYEDLLTARTIANYMGISDDTVRRIVGIRDMEKHNESVKKYQANNREHHLKVMREYMKCNYSKKKSKRSIKRVN